jgi:hypothetical protein
MAYTALAEGDWLNSEGGTAIAGPANQVTDVIAPDGTVFATGVEGDLEYARIWNEKVPKHMANLGIRTHYLKPVSSSQIWCCINEDCTPRAHPGPCPEVPSKTTGLVMIQSTYPAITEDLTFNANGVSSWNGQAEPCDTCFF